MEKVKKAIIEACIEAADTYGITLTEDDITGRSRDGQKVMFRTAAMTVLRQKYTLQGVGRIFNRDHTTVIHALDNHKEWSNVNYYPDYSVASYNVIYKKILVNYEKKIISFQIESLSLPTDSNKPNRNADVITFDQSYERFAKAREIYLQAEKELVAAVTELNKHIHKTQRNAKFQLS